MAPSTESGLAAWLAAAASVGAAAIHFAVAPTHWQQSVSAGSFFVGLGLCQLIWAPTVLVRTTAPVLAFGVVLNIGAVALWAQSLSAAAPSGAELCALLLQVYVVMGAGWVWYRGPRRGRVPALVNAAVLLVIGAVIASASTLGVASGLGHAHPKPAADENTSRPRANVEIIVAPG